MSTFFLGEIKEVDIIPIFKAFKALKIDKKPVILEFAEESHTSTRRYDLQLPEVEEEGVTGEPSAKRSRQILCWLFVNKFHSHWIGKNTLFCV